MAWLEVGHLSLALNPPGSLWVGTAHVQGPHGAR